MIGHKGHPEVEGTMGQSPEGMFLVETVADVGKLIVNDPERLAYVTQTTLSVDDADKVVSALKDRFPAITGPKRDDICYATQNRQDAVKELSEKSEIVFVVGSQSSSNSNRLREVAEHIGVKAHLIDNAQQIDLAWLEGKSRIGLTAGASAPEVLVQEVVKRLTDGRVEQVDQLLGTNENVIFPLPKELQDREQQLPATVAPNKA
jgi:4-hydroxy-3-methylbut-2-enyl diphosphate reductase